MCTAVVPDVCIQYGLASASRTDLKSWRLSAHTGETQAHHKLVADQPEAKADKTGIEVIGHDRHVSFQMAEVAALRILFANILRLVAEPGPPLDLAPT